MRIGRKLLLALCATSMCAGVAWAQAPVLGPGDGSSDYKDPSQDAAPLKRVDKQVPGELENIVYMTKGTKNTFYVAPSIFSYPSIADGKVGEYAGTEVKWTWEFHDPTAVGTKFSFSGYTAGSVTNVNSVAIQSDGTQERGEAVIKVTEQTTCMGAASTLFKIISTDPPTLFLSDAKLDGTGFTTTGSYAAEAGLPAELHTSTGFLFKTCDENAVTGKNLEFKLNSKEDNVPDPLRKYAFEIKSVVYRHKTGFAAPVVTTGVVETHDTDAGHMEAVPTSGKNITIASLPAPALAADEDYVDYIYYLSNSAAGKDGVVSAVSQRSDIVTSGTAPAYTDHTFYPYDKTSGFFVCLRITKTPKTGPVYFIPYLN